MKPIFQSSLSSAGILGFEFRDWRGQGGWTQRLYLECWKLLVNSMTLDIREVKLLCDLAFRHLEPHGTVLGGDTVPYLIVPFYLRAKSIVGTLHTHTLGSTNSKPAKHAFSF